MELPNQNNPHFFSQMLQKFPNIPHEIILLYTSQYSKDAETCIQMLNLQNRNYSSNECNDYIINSSMHPQFRNLNEDVNQPQDTIDKKSNFSRILQSSENPQLSILNNNNQNNSDLEKSTLYANCFPNKLQPLKEKQTDFAEEQPVPNIETSFIGIQSPIASCYKDSKQIMNEDIKKIDLNLSSLNLDLLPHILHINIDNDEESIHSWRPNMTLNCLSSDFLLSKPAHENTCTSNDAGFSESAAECSNGSSELNFSIFPTSELSHIYSSPNNFSRANESTENEILNYLNIQKIQFNVMRYEVMKAKTELESLKETAEKLSQELKEKKQSREALNFSNLSKENADLRLECQCLCMEVDYYLKGKAILGETDESNYKDKASNMESCHEENHPDSSTHFDQVEDHDECNKWECSKCTFANHPAINACEMCQMPRINGTNLVYATSVPETCYCHPSSKVSS